MEDHIKKTSDDNREILSVSEVNQAANDFLNEAFPPLWIVGEISNFKEYGSSGHWYFSLKDSDSVLNAAMFRLQNIGLRFKPKEGDQVIIQGKLSIWKKTGRYQIIASKMELAGFGELLRKFEQLKNKLNEEGLFQLKNENQLPEVVNKIALITSKNGAAIKDVISTVKRRAPHLEVVLFPVKVQGQGSSESVVSALESIKRLNVVENFETLLICRGGGSIEDLWTFNNENICREIAHFPIPVISGVGHETDFTLVDFVSNLRAATPTAAAEIVSEGASKVISYLEEMRRLLQEKVQRVCGVYKEKLQVLIKLIRSPKQIIQEQYLKLDYKTESLKKSMDSFKLRKKEVLQKLDLQLKNQTPDNKILMYKNQLISVNTLLQKELDKTIISNINKTKYLEEQLNALNPVGILDRGYSITYDHKGGIIRDSAMVSNGDKIKTKLASGEIQSEVTK